MTTEEQDLFKIYQSGDKYYKIDLSQTDAFKQSKPDAKEVSGFSVGDKKYDVKKIAKIGKVSDFVSQKPGAKPIYVEDGVSVQAPTPATSKQNVQATKAEAPKLGGSKAAMYGTDIATQKQKQERATKVLDQQSINAYEVTQETVVAKSKRLKAFDNNISNVTGPSGFDELGGKFKTRAPKDFAKEERTPFEADLRSAQAKADKARLAYQENIEKIIASEINSKGVDAFRETNLSGDKKANPDKISAWANDIVVKNGGKQNGYAHQYLKKMMESAVDSYDLVKEAEKQASDYISKKYNVKGKGEDLVNTANQIIASANQSTKVLSDQLNEASKIEMEQAMTPVNKAFKDNGNAFSTLNQQYKDSEANIMLAYQSGAMDEKTANDSLAQVRKGYEDGYKKLAADFDALTSQALAIESSINNKYKARYRREVDEVKMAADARVAQIESDLKKLNADPKLVEDYRKAFETIYKQKADAKQAEIMARTKADVYGRSAFVKAFVPYAGPVADWMASIPNFLTSFSNGLGGEIERVSSFFQWEAGEKFGADIATAFTKPQFNINSWKDLTDPVLVSGSAGQTIGGMAPMIGMQAITALATGGMSIPAQMAIQGGIGFTMETMSMAGGMYDDVFTQTGDVNKANEAANDIVKDQLKTFYLYALDGLPFINKITFGIKGKGILATAGRAGLKGVGETLTEIPQEFVQGGAEERAMMKTKDGKEVPLSQFIDIFNNKGYIDSNGKVVTPRERLESTALNVIPATLLTGGVGEVTQYGQNKFSETMGRISAIKSSFSEISPSFHNQYVFDIFLNRGEAFASGYVRQLMATGQMTKPQYENIVSNFQNLQEVYKLYSNKKVTKDEARVLTALSVSVNSEKAALASATNQIERDVAQQRYDAAKSKYDAYIKGQNGSFVIIDLPNGERYISSYEEFENMLGNTDFVEAAKENIDIRIVGDGKTTSNTNLADIAKLKLNLNEQGQYDPNAIIGREVSDIFAKTEIPYANQYVESIENRMQNAEDIPMDELNIALDNLYKQLETVFDTYYESDAGKAAAKILLDKIDQIKSYEFATDKETKVIAETSTVQTARDTVGKELGILQNARGPRATATITSDDGTTGTYSIEIDGTGNVTFQQKGAEPIQIGDVNETNKSARLVDAQFDEKGMPTSITFTVKSKDGNEYTINVNTSNKLKSEKLMDLAIDIRANEIGTVDPTAFDEALRTVETTVYPNIPTGKAEAKPTEAKPTQAKPTEAKPAEVMMEKPDVKKAIDNLQRGLQASGISVQLVEDPAEWERITSQYEGASEKAEGMFVSAEGKIYLDRNKLNQQWGRTIIFHEGTHPIINIIRNTDPKLYNSVVNALRAEAKRNTKIADVEKWANSKYDESRQEDEFIVETMARIADGKIVMSQLSTGLRRAIIDFINKIGVMLGNKKAIAYTDYKNAIELAKKITAVVKYGKGVETVVGAENVSQFGFTGGQERVKTDDNPIFFENAKAFANESAFDNKVQFKKALQDKIKAYEVKLKKKYGNKFDLKKYNDALKKYLVETLSKEAANSIDATPHAIGWYGVKTRAAISIMALIHPELKTDVNALSAFIFATAVTSNGNKVDKNFEYAEEQYRYFRDNGRFNEKGEYGAQQVGIKKTFKLINLMLDQGMSMSDINEFFISKFRASDLKYRMPDGKLKSIVSGELADEEVFGAMVLGPKIGNGFFINLWGDFSQLTMDRWFMRTWGRLTGSLLTDNPGDVIKKENKLKDLISQMKSDKEAYRIFRNIVGPISSMKMAAVANKIEKVSAKKDLREKLSSLDILNEIRKAGNNLAKAIRGEKEAPQGGKERRYIREVFNDVIDKLANDYGINIEMADLQAVLWYPEKALYESFKSGQEYDDIQDDYAEDTAPDYQNAAKKIAIKNGKSEQEISKAIADGPGDAFANTRSGSAIGSQGIGGPGEGVLKKIRAAKGGAEDLTIKPRGKKIKQESVGERTSPQEFLNNVSAEVERIKAATGETGVTLNLDGTTYKKGGLVVPAGSLNVPQSEVSVDGLLNFIEQNRDKISSDIFKVGLYRFKNRPEVSYDLNIVIPNKYRDIAIEFGRLAGQESLFDLNTFENIKTGSDGKNPIEFNAEQLASIAQDLSSGRMPSVVQPSTGNRDLVSGTYYEPNLTTDKNGNYVFFHVSNADPKSILKGIDSRKFQSLRTSREEKGLQYGVASFYTKPTDGERVVGGDKYYVTIRPEDVYPMDTDPNGYRAAAAKKNKEGTPFREEKIKKAIADAATKDGYQMAVGEWTYDRAGRKVSEFPALRGDALVKLIPKAYTGNEKFTTGEDRGVTTQYPGQAYYAAKQDLSDIASDIESARSKKNKYDDVYEVANNIKSYGGIIENYGTPNEMIRDINQEEFDTLYSGATPSQKKSLDNIQDAYLAGAPQFSEGGRNPNITRPVVGQINWERSGYGKGDVTITQRKEIVQQAANDLKEGKITNEEHRATVSQNSPINPITKFFEPATLKEIIKSLKETQIEYVGAIIKAGQRIALRLDIPAYKNHNTWVVSIHDGTKQNGDIISYENVAKIKNVVFSTSPYAALNIASGKEKQTIARMYGDFVPIPGETMEERGENAKQMIQDIVDDPAYVQVGMNPFRHSYFYDRNTDIGRPIVSAEEVIQVGGLVYAKNPVYGNWTDESFRVKNLFDKAGFPVQFSEGGRGDMVMLSGNELSFETLSNMYMSPVGSTQGAKYGDVLEYSGNDPKTIEVVNYINRKANPYVVDTDELTADQFGKLKGGYIESELFKAWESMPFNRFMFLYRKHIDPYLKKESRNIPRGMSWEEVAADAVLGTRRTTSDSDAFMAFAKDAGITIPPFIQASVGGRGALSSVEETTKALDNVFGSNNFIRSVAKSFPNRGITGGVIITDTNGTELAEVELGIKNDSAIELENIVSRAAGKGEGFGTKALSILKNMADIHGVKMFLYPEPIKLMQLTGLNKNALIKFYEKNGFKYFKALAQSVYSPKDSQSTSQAYHQAKQDGSNPELVKAVEDILTSPEYQASVGGRGAAAPITQAAGGPTPVNVRRRGGISVTGLRRTFAGPEEQDLRDAILADNRSYYTPTSWAKIKDKIDTMSEADLIDQMDLDPDKIYMNFVTMNGPSAPLAFVKYYQLMRKKADEARAIGNISEAESIEADIKDKFLDVKSIGTVAAKTLSMFRLLKSTRNDAEFHTDIIEAIIESTGGMLSKEQRTRVLGMVQNALSTNNFYEGTKTDVYTRGASAITPQDLLDLKIAEVWKIDAAKELNIYISILMQDNASDIYGSSLKGHLLGISSMIISAVSNILNMPNRAAEQAAQRQVIRIGNMISNLSSGKDMYGRGVKTAFGKPLGTSVSGIISSLNNLLSSVKEFALNPFKFMYNKTKGIREDISERKGGETILSAAADIIVYGNRDNSEKLYGTTSQLNPWVSLMRVLGKNKKPVGDFRSLIKDINQSFKKTDFIKWLSQEKGMTYDDYSELGDKDKVDLRESFFKDKLSVQPVTRSVVKDVAKAAAAAAEFNFRVISLTDYIPRNIQEKAMLDRIASTLGLTGVDKDLFMHDPYSYVENRNDIVSKEVLNYWNEYAAELTLTKKTFMGSASVNAANLAKFGVRKFVRKNKMQDTVVGDTVEAVFSLGTDIIMPFVQLPMNATSYALDFAWPWKAWTKAVYFNQLSRQAKKEGKDGLADSYDLSATKYIGRGFIGSAYIYLAMQIISIPGLIALGSGEDDDDEERKINKDMPRNRLNISAFNRYIKGLAGIGDGDTRFRQGEDKTIDLMPLGVLGMMIYAYGNAYKRAKTKYLNQEYNPDLLNRDIGENKTLNDYAWAGNEDPDMFSAMMLQFQALDYYFDQAWYMGIANWTKALTAKGDDADYLWTKATHDMAGTAISASVLFSNYAKKASDVAYEMDGRPLPDLSMKGLGGYNKAYWGEFAYKTLSSRNGLVDFISGVDPYKDQYLSFSLFGKEARRLKGAPRDLPGTIWALNTPTREVVGDWTEMERYYTYIYGQRGRIKLLGDYSMDLREPYLGTVESMEIPGEDLIKKTQYAGKFQVPAADYNQINMKSGRIREKLYNILSEKWMNSTINGVRVLPEDIDNPKLSDTKQINDIKKGIAVAISESNKIVKDFMRPWSLFKGDKMVKFIGLNTTAQIQELNALVDSYVITYNEYDPNSNTAVPSYNYLSNEEIRSGLVEIARMSIDMYVRELEKSKINYNEIQRIQKEEDADAKDLMNYIDKLPQ